MTRYIEETHFSRWTKAFIKLLSLAALSLFFVSCMPEKPKIDRQLASATFQHSRVDTTNCASCHEKDRPALGTAAQSTFDPVTGKHGRGRDCAMCHQPDGPQGWFNLVAFDHSSADASSCVRCHEHKKPRYPHPQTGDCVSCHTYNVWKNVPNFNHPQDLTSCNLCHDDGSSHLAPSKKGRPPAPHPQGGRDCFECHNTDVWSNRKTTFDHNPKPPNCVGCHSGTATPAPKAGRPALPHTQTGQCISCHNYPSWNSVISFDHSDPGITSCNGCHSAARPVDPHPQGGDCITCHSFPSWFNLKQYDHNPTPTSCQGCHDGQNPHSTKQRGRPALPHPQGGGDCNSCHTYPNWTPTIGYDHNPSPQSCAGCHVGTNPTPPKMGRPTRGDHPQSGDCASCHTYPNWGDANPTNFNHLPTPTSCNGCHSASRPAAPHTQTGDCASCHSFPNWSQLNSFNHTGVTQCASCHQADAGTNNLYSYPIGNQPPGNSNNWGTGHYIGQDCGACHRPTTTAGGSWVFDEDNHTNPFLQYCLPCHYNSSADPSGLAVHGMSFPYANGGTCTSCHTSPQEF